MATRPRIAIIGTGNLGNALAVALRRAAYTIEAVIARPGRASQMRAQTLASKVNARVASASLEELNADVVWFCVPDSQIEPASEDIAKRVNWKKKVALHSSGALTSDALSELRKRGASVASAHPLMTFVRGSRPSLAGVPFAIEGDARAVRLARGIIRDLGGHTYAIRKSDKIAYHAWGMFASPLLTALLVTTEQVAAAAGVKRKDARRRMIPILLQTLANYASFDAKDAFSGPIIRGDVETVKRHLRVLRGTPAAEVYLALARAAVVYLPVKHKNSLRRILDSSRD